MSARDLPPEILATLWAHLPTEQRASTHHNAKDDAINQANHLIAMLTPAAA